jgi:type IV secretory pathway TrbF-like protein
MIIGGKKSIAGCQESVMIVSRKLGTTFLANIILYGALLLAFSLSLLLHFLKIPILSVAACGVVLLLAFSYLQVLTCGIYMGSCDTQNFLHDGEENRRSIPLAMAYAAAFAAVTTLTTQNIKAANPIVKLQPVPIPSVSIITPPSDPPAFTQSLLMHKRLADFIINARSVYATRSLEKKSLEKAYKNVLFPSEAFIFLQQWYPTHNPFILGRKESRRVHITAFSRTSQADTYHLEWTEAVQKGHRKAPHIEYWQGEIRTSSLPASKGMITRFAWRKLPR